MAAKKDHLNMSPPLAVPTAKIHASKKQGYSKGEPSNKKPTKDWPPQDLSYFAINE